MPKVSKVLVGDFDSTISAEHSPNKIYGFLGMVKGGNVNCAFNQLLDSPEQDDLRRALETYCKNKFGVSGIIKQLRTIKKTGNYYITKNVQTRNPTTSEVTNTPRQYATDDLLVMISALGSNDFWRTFPALQQKESTFGLQINIKQQEKLVKTYRKALAQPDTVVGVASFHSFQGVVNGVNHGVISATLSNAGFTPNELQQIIIKAGMPTRPLLDTHYQLIEGVTLTPNDLTDRSQFLGKMPFLDEILAEVTTRNKDSQPIPYNAVVFFEDSISNCMVTAAYGVRVVLCDGNTSTKSAYLDNALLQLNAIRDGMTKENRLASYYQQFIFSALHLGYKIIHNHPIHNKDLPQDTIELLKQDKMDIAGCLEIGMAATDDENPTIYYSYVFDTKEAANDALRKLNVLFGVLTRTYRSDSYNPNLAMALVSPIGDKFHIIFSEQMLDKLIVVFNESCAVFGAHPFQAVEKPKGALMSASAAPDTLSAASSSATASSSRMVGSTSNAPITQSLSLAQQYLRILIVLIGQQVVRLPGEDELGSGSVAASAPPQKGSALRTLETTLYKKAGQVDKEYTKADFLGDLQAAKDKLSTHQSLHAIKSIFWSPTSADKLKDVFIITERNSKITDAKPTDAGQELLKSFRPR